MGPGSNDLSLKESGDIQGKCARRNLRRLAFLLLVLLKPGLSKDAKKEMGKFNKRERERGMNVV